MNASLATTVNALASMEIESEATELNDKCQVCQQALFGHKDVFIADCQHRYHGRCLSRWQEQVEVARRRICLTCGDQTLPWGPGHDSNESSSRCKSWPLLVCRDNDLQTLQQMLATDPGVARRLFHSARAGRKITLLHVAAGSGHEACVRALLDGGADINSTAPNQGVTPLYLAAGAGHTSCVQLLIRHGARLGDLTKGGWTPVQSAAKRGDYQCLLALLDAGVDANKSTNSGWTPLHSTAQSASKKCTAALLAHGAHVDARTAHGWSPLHLSMQSGCIECVQELLNHGADINARTGNGKTPLYLATEQGWEDAVRYLLFKGCSGTYTTKDRHPVIIAVGYNRIGCLLALIRHGFDANVRLNNSLTPLHLASKKGFAECTHVLIEGKADVNAIN